MKIEDIFNKEQIQALKELDLNLYKDLKNGIENLDKGDHIPKIN